MGCAALKVPCGARRRRTGPTVDLVVGSAVRAAVASLSEKRLILVFGGPGSRKGQIVNDLANCFGFEMVSAEKLILAYFARHLHLHEETSGPVGSTQSVEEMLKKRYQEYTETVHELLQYFRDANRLVAADVPHDASLVSEELVKFLDSLGFVPRCTLDPNVVFLPGIATEGQQGLLERPMRLANQPNRRFYTVCWEKPADDGDRKERKVLFSGVEKLVGDKATRSVGTALGETYLFPEDTDWNACRQVALLCSKHLHWQCTDQRNGADANQPFSSDT
ncbi:hypothetical protein HPB52_023841 [Rhipicephalus sanguineus]|uniref:Adenylate kinase n=1 Tax=Rhipicephalus sanguineus TaxID=34632 RepID=A0A9D4SX01_RHISA|nr:hypothetical protein HPB52_023841 [Rhipicephalus sanguineus]